MHCVTVNRVNFVDLLGHPAKQCQNNYISMDNIQGRWGCRNDSSVRDMAYKITEPGMSIKGSLFCSCAWVTESASKV